MKSLGVIETRGLVAAVQAVDAACKAAGVACIGYRKVGSGLVSVCFEGEISAIHTAVERGVAVAKISDPQVTSLVIARPERCVVEALSNLKGHPPRAAAPTTVVTEPAIEAPAVEPQPLVPAPNADEKHAANKKGKKA
ncbi:TPA: BMC domain-containing protein [Kluyvera ascorbata]|uniref:BMC domain-containing protein n=1 Tax=Kluyvera genomosp. 3 TaxID=2774055 RepID=A0A248KIZ4_9ENTR|nr:BMC domain-containing protein [Kluyvera sp. CRP]ASG63678.1 BMC domain-containing protein [Kluyvera genomosp. 3]UAK18476.1 BMC domain-containing protein [Kluyvera sp. CRP]HCR3982010.1 BMC domain-containing protein [Kluyvera ascorbata]HDT6547243.1 BMC domain-containing protein [Kluyvera ascorbata]